MAEKARILLVDDRQENLTALEAILSSLDQTLVRANSGEEALKALLMDEFAVILLDVQMPGMDGFETASHIKRRERTKDIPIIFLTVSHDPHHAFRGYASGAVDYLAKPFDPWILRAKVSVFVELYQKNRQLREQATLLQYRLTAGSAGGNGQGGRDTSADELLADLSDRLAAVEAQVGVLGSQTGAAVDGAIAGSVTELEHRVARLRAALDAFSPAP